MTLNFDAEIRLDIGPFLTSIIKAQNEVKQLSNQIDAINKKTLSVKTSTMGAGAITPSTVSGAGSRARMAAASDEIALQNQIAKTAKIRDEGSKQAERNMARERYALYDVAAAYTAVAGAAAVAVKATAGTAIEFERAFVNVERTTDFVSAKIGAAAESAKNDLKALASEIPVAFGEITQIATIGNQLGIAQGALTSFTETVAKFSATTGVSVDSTAMAFGRIGELLGVPAQDFEKLGSAIAFAGVNAVATEEQILSVTKEIATTAKMAKFSSADIVGLSTALSSLGIAPEAARGSIIRTFAGINKVISEGGDQLQQYAAIAGMSAEQFSSTWQENGQVAFSALLKGLQGLSNEGQNLDSVLRSLGMKNVRDIQTIQKLGDNYDVYASSLADANQGFKEGTFLGSAYGKIQDTVASKLELVSNNWKNLLDTLGQSGVGDVFKSILDGVNSLLVRLNQLAKTPVGQGLGVLVTVGGLLVTVIAAINAVSALAQASLRAFAVAQTSLIGTTEAVTISLTEMNGQLVATGIAGNTMSLGLKKGEIAAHALNTALKAFKWLAIITAVTIAVQEMAIAFSSAEQKAESLVGGFSGLQDALRADLDAYNTSLSDLGGDINAAKAATGVVAELSTAYENNSEEVNKTIEAQNNLNTFLGISSNNTSLLSTEVNNLSFVIGANTRAWLINAIAQSEAFQKMSENSDAMQAIIDAGFNINTALEAAANGTLDEYLASINTKAITGASWFEQLNYVLYNLGDIVGNATQNMGFLGTVLTKIAGFVGWLVSLVPRLVNELARFVGIDFFPVSNGLQQTGDVVQGVVNQMKILGPSAAAVNQELASANADEYANQLEKLRKNANGASKALRTVVDYANDLRSIFSRSFEIRFGQQEMLDKIASGWNDIAKNAEDAQRAIRDANAEIQGLTADKSILEYQLSVAVRYGDEKRAAEIRAEIAKIDNSIADERETISKANAELTKSTEGSTDAAIENRAILLDQLQSYMDYVEMLAKTGLKGKALTKEINSLKESFIQQALKAGYSKEEIKKYAKSFDDMAKAVKKTPRNVDVEFKSNISPAQQALNEYIAKLKQANGTYTTKIKLQLPNTTRLKKIVDSEVYRFMLRAFENDMLTAKQFYKGVYGIDLRNYATGGLVTGPGSGTSDSIPAMLSNGEFVMKSSAVSAYGVDFLNALNQQKVGAFTASSAQTQTSAGASVTYLSPEDRALLKAALDRPIALYTENTKIAQSANAGNVVLAQRGSR